MFVLNTKKEYREEVETHCNQLANPPNLKGKRSTRPVAPLPACKDTKRLFLFSVTSSSTMQRTVMPEREGRALGDSRVLSSHLNRRADRDLFQ